MLDVDKILPSIKHLSIYILNKRSYLHTRYFKKNYSKLNPLYQTIKLKTLG